MVQESKAGSSVRLPLEELRPGVHAFGTSVVVMEADRSGDGPMSWSMPGTGLDEQLVEQLVSRTKAGGLELTGEGCSSN